jgi:hypothetical protein
MNRVCSTHWSDDNFTHNSCPKALMNKKRKILKVLQRFGARYRFHLQGGSVWRLGSPYTDLTVEDEELDWASRGPECYPIGRDSMVT